MQAVVNQEHSKLPLKVKLAYGLSGYSSFMTWSLFSMYGLYFFTDVIGFAAAFAGFIMSIGTVWDAITDPIIGGWSDNRQSKYGRRRPLIIGIALPFCLISILLFTNFQFSQSLAKIYFIIIILAYYTVQTVLDISCSALGSEMTLDYDERTSLATLKNFFAMVVVLAASPTLILVDFFGKNFSNEDLGWTCTVATFITFSFICIIIIWRATKGYEKYYNEEKVKFRDLIETISHNKPMRYVMILFALGVIANTFNLSLQVYYWTYFVKLTAGQISTIILIGGISACISTFVVSFLCVKYSKKVAWIISIGLWLLSIILFIGFVIKPGMIVANYILWIMISLGVSAIYQVPWSMIPDCVEVHELRTGKRMEGLIFGFTAFVQKASAAIGILVVGLLLTFINYIPNEVQSIETMKSLKMVYLLGMAIPFAVSLLIAYKYPLSKDRHRDVLEAIELQKQGKPYNESDFKDLM